MKNKSIRNVFAILVMASLSSNVLSSEALVDYGGLSPVEHKSSTGLKDNKAVSLGKSTNDLPNDEWFIHQWHWYGLDQEYENSAGGSEMSKGANILRAFNDISKNKAIRVGVIDFGFYEFEGEIDYSKDGYSFAEGNMSSIGPNFYEEDTFEEACIPHGASIAHIIGGNTNNTIGGSGIADVDLVAVKVATCGGYGTMDQIVDAINYLVKQPMEGGPIISEPVDVINISLGINGQCGDSEQNAINLANDAGIPVVVAAGNETVDIENLSPANCENVIVIGASDKNGKLTEFSNYGSGVDVLAPGHSIAARGNYGELGLWDGTSQAAPIVTGAIAMIRGENYSLSPGEIEEIIKSTSTKMTADECLGFNCGSGRIDVFSMLKESRIAAGGDISFMSDAISSLSDCKKELYADVLGGLESLCGTTSIQFEEDFIDGNTYKLYRVKKGSFFKLSNAELVSETNSNKTIVNNLDLASYSYGYLKCDSGICDSDISSLNMANSVSEACIK